MFFIFIHILSFFFLTLQYCTGFAIYQNESATGIHVFPIFIVLSIVCNYIHVGYLIVSPKVLQNCKRAKSISTLLN